MSGGEEEGRTLRHIPHSLDAWRRCEVDGCDWHVPLPQSRCWVHGGHGPAYVTTASGETAWHWSDDGEVVRL